MLKDEFQRLIKIFQDGAEGKPVNLAEVFSQSIEFFQHLKLQIEKGSPDEKKEAMQMMAELYNQMMAETQKITQRSGVSEEQLVAFAENPANFSPEQWKQIQESKQKITQAGQELSKVMQDLTKGAPPPKSDKDDKKGKKSKKSQWMRS
jgi:hypothetical protein